MTRRPRLVVGTWIFLIVALAVYGQDLGRKLDTQLLYIDGSIAKRAHDISVREFGGGEDAMIVMLRGPEAALNEQGPALTRRLSSMRRTVVVSPWDTGAGLRGLRPEPTTAVVIVRVERRPNQEVADLLPPVQSQAEETLSAPVDFSVGGLPAVLDTYRQAIESGVVTGELIAIPVLLIVLLLVFRSALAALMPVVVGGAVVVMTRGVLSLFAEITEINLFALSLVGMLGLALGVDYSLLVVSRFREERKRHDLADAVGLTTARTARSVIPAGCGLILAMLIAPFVLPSSIAGAISIAVTTATVLSMLSALLVVPALLMMLGPRLDRWSLPERRPSQIRSLRWSRWLIARPRAVVAIIVSLLLCAGLSSSLNTRNAGIDLLPPDDPGRKKQELIEQTLGPGWTAPMEVVVNGRGGPITTPDRLRALAAFQRKVERDPGVDTVAGPMAIVRSAKQLEDLEEGLVAGERGLERLETGLARAHDGAALNTSGLLAAAEGSRQLDSGIGAANGGAGLLAGVLEAVSAGSGRLSSGLGSAEEGSGKLAEGASEASSGAARLAEGLQRAREGTGEIAGTARLFRNAMLSGEEQLAELDAPLGIAEERLRAALQALQQMTTGRTDPQYATALRAIEEASRHLGGDDPRSGEQADPNFDGIEAGVERARGQFDLGRYLAARLDKAGDQARKGIAKLARGSAQLDRGLDRLESGSERLSDGIAALAAGGERLSPALVRLSEGAESLEGGLTQLGAGSSRLADGLGGGAQKSKLLTGGLKRIGTAVRHSRGGGEGSPVDRLREQSPGLFSSGYLVLAGLDGARPRQRDRIDFLINLDRGGRSARMLVIPNDPAASSEVHDTKERLEADAGELARKTDTEVLVGGVAANDIEVNEALREQAPSLRLALALVTFLILLPVVRSLTLAVLAALLNLVTVGATFGLLALLFNTSLLGGPGYIDVTALPTTVIIIFGLAIDYEVFVFARIREEYLRTGSTRLAIERGLDHTAPVVSGAAMIMIAVFLAFSVSAFMPLRNFGIAQAIGVFLDAFIIRLVIVPSAMRWLGKWCWWMPRWLDRLLPGAPAPTPPQRADRAAYDAAR